MIKKEYIGKRKGHVRVSSSRGVATIVKGGYVRWNAKYMVKTTRKGETHTGWKEA